jgi:hypothetical protein
MKDNILRIEKAYTVPSAARPSNVYARCDPQARYDTILSTSLSIWGQYTYVQRAVWRPGNRRFAPP